MFDDIRLSFRALREQWSLVDVHVLLDEPPIFDTRKQRAWQRDRAPVAPDIGDLELARKAPVLALEDSQQLVADPGDVLRHPAGLVDETHGLGVPEPDREVVRDEAADRIADPILIEQL